MTQGQTQTPLENNAGTRHSFTLGGRRVGETHPPLIIAEVGINHEGSMDKARRMIDDVAAAGGECVKFQCHVIDDEMVPAAKQVVPGNASESIWDIMARAALSEAEERALKDYAEDKGLAYLSTPFSRMAADRLESMGVQAYKIGSGECNNYPLVDHVAAFGKPMIVSTGMNDLSSIGATVEILDKRRVPYALLQCTSMYPTPYDRVQLGALADLAAAFPRALLGLSCHSIGVYTGLGAIPLGARIVEKHFTSDPTWPGPDIPISITPAELGTLVAGSRAIFAALGGHKRYLREEKVTADFAYACVVTTQSIRAGERLTVHNCWVKRPGTGEILAVHYPKLLGRRVTEALCAGQQLEWTHLSPESP